MTSLPSPARDFFRKYINTLHVSDVVTILTVMVSCGLWAWNGIDKEFVKINDVLERIERDNRDFHGRLSYMEGKQSIKDGKNG